MTYIESVSNQEIADMLCALVAFENSLPTGGEELILEAANRLYSIEEDDGK